MLIGLALACVMALPASAECYADYKASKPDPVGFAYGVSQVSDAACGNNGQAKAELGPRLAAGPAEVFRCAVVPGCPATGPAAAQLGCSSAVSKPEPTASAAAGAGR
jgi:hypothetical protein